MSNVPTNLIPTRITGLPEYMGTSTLGYIPYILDGRTYKVQFGQIAAVGAVPSTRVIAAGTGLAGGGDLSENRVISIANGGVGFDQLSATGVVAGSYGSGSEVPVVTVDLKGRITDISTTPLVITGYVPDSRLISTGAGLLGGGSLASNRTLSVDFSSATPQALGSATAGVSNAAARGDHVHPAVNLSDTNQTQGALPLGRGGTGDALSPVAGAVVYSTGTKFALADPGDPGQVLTSNGSGEPYWRTITGTGTVTNVSVLTANGFSGTVAFADTTPQITLSTTVNGMIKGDGLSMLAAAPGVDYVAPSAYISSGLTMATSRLLGRTDLGTGEAQEITVGTGLSLSAGSLVNSAPDQTVTLTGGTAISISGTYPSFTITNTAPDQIVSLTGAGTTTVTGTYPNFTITSNDQYVGTVTSVAASGGSTGLTFSGSPITTSGTLTLGGTLAVASGGTGATTAAGARTNLGAAASGANSDITSLSGITGGIATPDYIDFDTTATVTRATGRLWWDNADGNQTLSLGMAGSNATLQIGEEMYFRIKASSAITEGQVVMFTGTVGNSGALTGAPATGLTKDTASYVMGVATEDIANNGWGYVTQFGLVRNINTTGGAEAWVDGQILYYDPTVPGGLTKNVPSAPNAKVEVAAVVNAGSNGSLFVRPIARFSLGQLNDVETSAATNGDLLQYNGSGGYWQHVVPSTISVGTATNLAGGASGSIPYQSSAGTTTFLASGTGVLAASGGNPSYTMSPSLTQVTVAADPTLALQVATKQYVDTLVASGITYHTPVKYEVPDTTGNLNATYNNGTAGVGATLTNAGTLGAFTPDGTVAQVGDRILIYNQTNAAQNGVYTVTTVGNGSTPWVLTRATDANSYALKSPTGLGEGDAFFVTSGATGAGETYVCNTTGTITFGTTPITFVQVSSAPVYTAGTGLTLTGNQFSLTSPVATSLGGTGLTSFTSGGAVYATSTSALTTGTLPLTAGGTGATTAAGARTSLGGTTVGSNFFTLTNPSAITFPQINADNTVSALSAAAFRAAIGAGTGGGSVTSVDVSGGTTGLTTSGGPITSSGTITLAGTLNVANGGTGATSLSSGYVLKGNGTSAVSASVIYDDGTNVGVGTATPAGKFSSNTGASGTYSSIPGNVNSWDSTVSLFGAAGSSTGAAVGIGMTALGGYISSLAPSVAWQNLYYQASTHYWYNGVTQLGILNTSGDFTALGSVRAPIFYDSNNTAYYLDAASNTTSMRTNGAWITNPTSAWGGEVAGKLEYHNNRWYASVNTAFVVRSTAGSEVFWSYNTGVNEASGDFRAPIFYDSNNTAYYLDAAGNSVLSNVQNGVNYTSGGGGGRLVVGPGSPYSLRQEFGSDNTGWRYGIAKNVSGTVTDLFYVQDTGPVVAIGDMRAPVFYDNNDTGYYVDPNSTSLLNTITVVNGISAYDAAWGSDPYGKIGVTRGSDANYSYYGLTRAGQLGMGMGIDTSNQFWIGGTTPGYGSTRSSAWFYMNTSGDVWANSSYRAPIFYDSNNTAYYLDAAGNSVFSAFNIGGGEVYFYGSATNAVSIRTGAGGAYKYFTFDASGNFYALNGSVYGDTFYDQANTGYYANPAGTSNLYTVVTNAQTPAIAFKGDIDGAKWMQKLGGYNLSFMNDGGAGFDSVSFDGRTYYNKFYLDNSGNAYAYSSFRAPIFYDSNNTSYYVDPASGSVLGGNISILGGRNITLSTSTGSVQIKGDTGGWSTGLLFYGSSSTYRGGFGALGSVDSLSYYWIGSDYNTAALYIYASGYAQASGSLRAPIFYDSNDTGYYVDAASNSVLNTLYLRTGSIQAKFAQPSQFGYSSSYRTVVLGNEYLTTISMGVDVSGNASGNFNGQGEGREVIFRNGVNFITPNSANNNYLYPLNMTDGYVTSSGSFRAPIFYDSNDTAYYCDPNWYSQFNYVWANNWFRSNGDTGWYSQTYAGGIYMIDTTWVRVYNGKAFYVPNEIAATGNITAYYSDERLKTKTGGIDNALDKVSSLEGFLYVENDLARSLGYKNDKQQVGVSAQQVQAVLPEAVSLAPVDFETLEDGTIVSKSGEDYLTVDYSRLVPLLIEAIKELKSEVNDLKAKLH